MIRILLPLLLLCCGACTLRTPHIQTDQLNTPKVLTLADRSATFTWDYTQTVGTSPIQGFKLQIGTAVSPFSRTIDIPNKDTRLVTVTGIDTSVTNSARLYSYNEWAVSNPSPEISFGGSLASPFLLKVSPANP